MRTKGFKNPFLIGIPVTGIHIKHDGYDILNIFSVPCVCIFKLSSGFHLSRDKTFVLTILIIAPLIYIVHQSCFYILPFIVLGVNHVPCLRWWLIANGCVRKGKVCMEME